MTPSPAVGGDDNALPISALAAAARRPGWVSFAARRGIKLLTQMANGVIVGGLSKMMQSYRQRLGIEVGNEVDFGTVDLP